MYVYVVQYINKITYVLAERRVVCQGCTPR